MAITKILHISSPDAMKASLDYVFDVEHAQEKTDGGHWIGGNAGCDPDTAYRRMLETKKRTGKESGRQAYHFILSFAKGETTPGIAYTITQEFCDRYLGDRYDHVFVIHTDREHLHGHIVFNSVSADGKKYHYKKGDWEKDIQPVVNGLCREYGLSEIKIEKQYPKRKEEGEKSINTGRANNPEKRTLQATDRSLTWKVINRQDMDEAIRQSDTYEGFLQNMRGMGYQVREGYSGKREEPYLSIRTYGMERSRRTYQLGKDYTVPNIKRRIASRDYILQVRRDLSDHPAKHPLKGQILSTYSTAFIRIQRLYLVRIGRAYRTYYRYTKPYPQAWKYKKDLIDMQKLIDRYNFLHRNYITDLTELEAYEDLIQEEKQDLVLERNRLYRKRDIQKESGDDAGKIDRISSEIRQFTDQIRQKTKEAGICRQIREDMAEEELLEKESIEKWPQFECKKEEESQWNKTIS